MAASCNRVFADTASGAAAALAAHPEPGLRRSPTYDTPRFPSPGPGTPIDGGRHGPAPPPGAQVVRDLRSSSP